MAGFFVAWIAAAVVTHACLWDRDTLKDEAAKDVGLLHLITGRLPAHGHVYYLARIEPGPPDPDDVDALNDHAVAHLRIGEADRAEGYLKLARAADPDYYPTLSNLGVLKKKTGDYAASARWIGAALEVNPEGHMGLGDWCLKAIEWRRDHGDDPDVAENFLGEPYGSWIPSPSAGKTDAASRWESIRRLLANDNHFADGFVVLGNMLAATEDYRMADLCFRRARRIGHPNQAYVATRLNHMSPMLKVGAATADAQAEKSFEEAENWVVDFQLEEARRLAVGEAVELSDLVDALGPGSAAVAPRSGPAPTH